MEKYMEKPALGNKTSKGEGENNSDVANSRIPPDSPLGQMLAGWDGPVWKRYTKERPKVP